MAVAKPKYGTRIYGSNGEEIGTLVSESKLLELMVIQQEQLAKILGQLRITNQHLSFVTDENIREVICDD